MDQDKYTKFVLKLAYITCYVSLVLLLAILASTLHLHLHLSDLALQCVLSGSGTQNAERKCWNANHPFPERNFKTQPDCENGVEMASERNFGTQFQNADSERNLKHPLQSTKTPPCQKSQNATP